MTRFKSIAIETLRRPNSARAACLCAWKGCAAEGVFRAPQDRTLSSYVMFCLDHVRAYNAKWDFHIHMTPADIEAEIRRMATWDRPTWPMSGNGPGVKKARPWSRPDIRDPMDLGAGTAFDPKQAKTKRTQSWATDMGMKPEERKALRVFDTDGPITLAELKLRYKELVKRHHPDKHGGSSEAETRMKAINGAYQLLQTALRRAARN